MATFTLDLGQTEVTTLIDMLKQMRESCMALSAARLTTEAERAELTRQALVCQITAEQLEHR